MNGRFFAACVGLAVIACAGLEVGGQAPDLAGLTAKPLGEGEAFRPVSGASLDAAASRLRTALGRLDSLLARSKSGPDWKKYLDWASLTKQAATGANADPAELRRLFKRLDAEENGLEMPQFAAVRRAVAAYADAAEAAKSADAAATYAQRLEKLSAAVAGGVAAGTTESLETVGPLLSRLEASGQAPQTVARVREAVTKPNLYLDVDESLLGSGVNRVVDEHTPIDDVVLGNRVRGSGHTTGLVLLDFVPSLKSAIIDLTLDATNHSDTRSSKGPVTVSTRGVTKVDARKRIVVDDQRVTSLPTSASASTSTETAGIGVKSKFAKNLIRKMAGKKIAQVKPKAEAISERRAQERVRSQFEEQTAGPIAKASADYQAKFRRPLMERGWYPESLSISTSDTRLSVVARKSLADQIAAFTPPPAVDPDAVLAARVHETLVNNAAEITLGGRTITQEFVEEQIKKNNGTLPESLGNDPDQPPWSITFAKRLPVQLDADDDRVKMTVRGSKFTSGDREFPPMDIWAAYRIEPADGKIRLVRDGDVQIYPPGFVPGGGEKLSVAETSLRRILQKRFNKVFKEVVDVEPMKLPNQLEHAGPLPMEQLVARKDGWVAVGWRKKDAAAPAGQPTLADAASPTQLVLDR
ncbi:MAG: hypothetical protein ACKOEX_14295 [Planctomycetia bacterium]